MRQVATGTVMSGPRTTPAPIMHPGDNFTFSSNITLSLKKHCLMLQPDCKANKTYVKSEKKLFINLKSHPMIYFTMINL